ncbi:MAG: DUF11 domain-containing protein, partial [Anaerolineae bacterium]|nr:DUF11 domain-containing protein [Anaerolineae bacterium]
MYQLCASAVRLGSIVVLVLVALAPASPIQAAPLAPLPTSFTSQPDLPTYAGFVVVKFREGAQVRLREGRLTDLRGASLDEATALLAAYGVQPRRLFQRPESVLDRERVQAELRSGQDLADLNLYFMLPLADADAAASLAQALDRLDMVQTAYPEPHPALAAVTTRPVSGDIGHTTPSFTAEQGYLYAPETSNGINAVYAWTVPGGSGSNVKFIDLEWGWQTTHEDLRGAKLFYEGGSVYSPWRDHGTAVIGEVMADRDASGVTGIAYNARYGIHGVGFDTWPNVADAINTAAAQLDAGDLMLLEMHNPTSPLPPDEQCDPRCGNCEQFGYIAMEYWQANFDAIQTAAAQGIIVVEAAGNGAMNFDNPFYGGAFDRNQRDAGAILVGAGMSGKYGYEPARGAECWTNYGSAVDVQGWGDAIWTLGYGDGWNEGMAGGSASDEDQWYTQWFGGTSGASPIVVGAITSIQGMRKAAGLPVLTPLQVRTLLRHTGTPQARDHKTIGRLPDLQAAAAGLFHTVVVSDAWGNGNGAAEPGEHGLVLEITLETLGITAYHDVEVTLESGLEAVEVRTPVQDYGTLAPDGGPVTRAFTFDLGSAAPCGALLPFTLTATSDQAPYVTSLALPTGVLSDSSLIFESAGGPVSIPDNSATGVSSVIAAPQGWIIGDLDVGVDITHARVNDLSVSLLGPDTLPQEVTLVDRAQYYDANYTGTVFDDEAIVPIYSAVAPRTGPYRPDGFLNNYDNGNPSGSWTLTVRDRRSSVMGTLDSWHLVVTPLECAARAAPTATLTAPAEVMPGQLLTYTLAIANPGALPLYQTTITAAYDAHTTFVAADPPPSQGDAAWGFDRIGPETTQWITLTVQVAGDVADGTALSTGVTLAAAETPTITAGTTTTVAGPALAIGKTAQVAAAGAPITFTLTLTNTGSVTATGVLVTDTLPLGAHYVAGGAYDGTEVAWTVPSLARAGGTAQVTLVVTACQAITNTHYRVAGSVEGATSGWGTPAAAAPIAPALAPAFTWAPLDARDTGPVVFTGAVTTDGGGITAWVWDFGDGAAGSGSEVAHTFATGAYTVTLTLTDTCGFSATIAQPLVVTAGIRP